MHSALLKHRSNYAHITCPQQLNNNIRALLTEQHETYTLIDHMALTHRQTNTKSNLPLTSTKDGLF